MWRTTGPGYLSAGQYKFTFLSPLESVKELTRLPGTCPGPRKSGLTEVSAAFYIEYESLLLQTQNVLLVCPWPKTFPPTSLEFSQK